MHQCINAGMTGMTGMQECRNLMLFRFSLPRYFASFAISVKYFDTTVKKIDDQLHRATILFLLIF